MKTEASTAHVRLFAGESFASFWNAPVRSWLDSAQEAWKDERPSVILVPSPGWIAFLKWKLVREGRGHVGLKFLIPSDMRRLLAEHLAPGWLTADAAMFQLLLSSVCSEQQDPLSRSISASPEVLWSQMEHGMTWNGGEEHDVIRRFHKLKKKARLATSQELDKFLVQKSEPPSRIFKNVLLLGFDARHWPEWNLLRAAVRSAEEGMVCLTLPRKELETLDMVWVNSWEEEFGEYELTEPVETKPVRVSFFSADGICQSAQTAVLKAVEALKNAGNHEKRIGILVPGAGDLAREVAALLSAAGVPHHDGVGHLPAPLSQQDAWAGWLEWQAEPGARSFLRFYRILSPEKWTRDEETYFTRALDHSMVDDLPTALAYGARSENPKMRRWAENFQSYSLLPEETSLGDFLNKASAFWLEQGWKDRAEFISRLKDFYPTCLNLVCRRRAFLKWLKKTTASQSRVRSPEGNHAFVSIYITDYQTAEGQAWDELILTGLNEGVWPAVVEESGWISEEEISKHNARLLKQGTQGWGHRVVKDGCPLCLGPAEMREIGRRQFRILTESVSGGLSLVWTTVDEKDAGKMVLPSALICEFFREQTGLGLGQTALEHLSGCTRRWLEDSRVPLPAVAVEDVQRTREAFEIRRDSNRPFGVYDFCIEKKLRQPLVMGCKECEDLLQSPGLVWMKHFLGVKPPRELEEDRWAVTRGEWVHQWMQKAIAEETTQQNGNEPLFQNFHSMERRLEHASERTLAWMKEVFHSAGLELPDWWSSAWEEARWCAWGLLHGLSQLDEEEYGMWRDALTEWELPVGFQLELPQEITLPLTGRMDLILLPKRYAEDGFSSSAWVMDYKTGKTKVKFSQKELERGKGVQAALYGLVVSQMGCEPVLVSLARPEQPIEPEIKADDVREFQTIWQTLSAMMRTGRFGMRGEVRPEFGFGRRYPMAMLPIEKAVLEERFKRTYNEKFN